MSWYELKHYSSTQNNPFNLNFYTYEVNNAGLVYYDAPANDELKANLEQFNNIDFYEQGYNRGVYSAEVGFNSGVYLVVSHNNITGQEEISNVIGINANLNNVDKSLNRAEVIDIIINDAYSNLALCTTSPFVDVPANHPNCPAIQFAKQRGLIQGYEDGTLHPDEFISRSETAKLLSETYKLRNYETTAQHFYDVAPNDWYYEYVEALHFELYNNYGFYIGYEDKTYRPHETTSKNWLENVVSYLYVHW